MSELSDFITPTGLPAEDLISVNNEIERNAHQISFYSEKFKESAIEGDQVRLKVCFDYLNHILKNQANLKKHKTELEKELYQL